MTTVGCYAFVTEDWAEQEYPLDLWLEHNLELFDQISLVCVGDVKLPIEDRRIVTKFMNDESRGFDFYINRARTAQELLETDWKVYTATDEFFSPSLVTRLKGEVHLDPTRAYAVRMHNFWGNLATEICAISSDYWSLTTRAHKGERGFGAEDFLSGPYSRKIVGEFWHTDLCRSLKALERKYSLRAKRIPYTPPKVDYEEPRLFYRHPYLVKVNPDFLPDVLKRNSDRFNWAHFDSGMYVGKFRETLYDRLHSIAILKRKGIHKSKQSFRSLFSNVKTVSS
ncbi:MAG TPA: hypothetical protein VJN71_07805 [Nitrososphaerales archaeon]|nr:hypothetical protein [Nitrososphaerales archaeon]